MKKIILLVAVVAAITAGWLLYFNEGEPLTFVSVYEAKRTNLENALEFSGEVSSANMYSVMSETGGTVSSIGVTEGSSVQKGDTLFTLDGTAVAAQLKEARLRAKALEEAGAQVVMAQQGGAYGIAEQKAKLALALSQTTGYDYDTLNRTFGSETAEKAQAAATSLAQSLGSMNTAMPSAGDVPVGTEIELARLAVQNLENLLESMTYKSEIFGTVIAVNVNQGEVLSPGIPAMVIADTDKPLVVGYVYEKDVQDLKVGMNTIITTDVGKYPGKLTKIGPAAMGMGDLAAAFDTMAKVEIEPADGFSKLLGAVVDIKIVLSSKADVLSIPVDCLTSDGCVFVVGEGDIAEKREIVTGFEDSFNVEVVSGLSEGDRVVASPKGIEEGKKLNYDRG